MTNARDRIITYYQKELSFLRSCGQDFATHFPNIAQRLDFNKTPSTDPHVERLLESFALLTGRLQQQIDDLAPEIATALLDALYPSFTRPIPSMALFCFDIDQSASAQSPGICVQKASQLFINGNDSSLCFFKTAHDLPLWPIEVLSCQVKNPDELQMEAPAYLHLRMRWYGPANQGPSSLRFYLLGSEETKNLLYKALFAQDFPVLVGNEEREPLRSLPPLQTIGWKDEENLLPLLHEQHRGFRLLEEYFAFPQKFLGADITAIPTEIWQETLSFYLPVTGLEGKKINIGPHLFGFNYVPGINLFDTVGEPIALDYTQTETLVIPDQRRYFSQEIYSINRVCAVNIEAPTEAEIPSYYTATYRMQQQAPTLFWIAKRKLTTSADLQGTDVFLSFVNLALQLDRPAEEVVYAHLSCTNRRSAEEIPDNGLFQIEQALPVKQIFCVERPTTAKAPPMSGEILWKLVALLSFESLSLSGESSNMLEQLKELLSILSKRIAPYQQDIHTLANIECSPSTRRLGRDGWRGFIPGQWIKLTIDDKKDGTANPILFSGVLSEFFRSYVSYNSFVETSVQEVHKTGITKTWPIHFGQQKDL
ncbi:MAG: type VI secretion system baseplate subunit TssF [Holosporales bacterium]|jgi:type VI secretion system protein ImpG|nr:type VI secretion system baseplate subunit TssF [Holosporales bacterium]